MAYSFLTNHHFYDFNQLLDHLEVRPGHAVLDLGCGHHGYWTFPMAKMVGRSGQVHALDIMPSAVDMIKRKSAELKLPQINPIWADMENLKKFKLPTADLALIVNVMHQIKNQKKLLTELKGLLRPKAKLLIIDWRQAGNQYGPPLEQRVAEQELIGWGKKARLDLAKEFYLDNDHFAKIFINN
ncbi:MAG: class I SAM-dependent methyltransferase [Patescibacteria group bacterium]